jgi:hypothetical protein
MSGMSSSPLGGEFYSEDCRFPEPKYRKYKNSKFSMLSMIFAIQIMNFGSDSIQKDQNAKNKSKALAGMKKIAGF